MSANLPKHLQSQGLHPSQHLQHQQYNTDEDVLIQDEELDQIREKYNNAYRLYAECQKVDSQNLSSCRGKGIKVASQNGLYDLEPALQGKIRDIILKKFQRNSFLKEIDLYPAAIHDSLQEKLGVKTSTEEFVKAMCKHFKKQARIFGEQYSFLFKKMVKFHTEYHLHENFQQLQQALELYSKKILRKKGFYMELYSRMSQGLTGEDNEFPQINMQQGNKLIFSHKLKQPGPHKPIRVLDYKLYLNDKIKKYKMTRNLRKFREIVKYLPIGVMSKLYPIKSKREANRPAQSSKEIPGSQVAEEEEAQEPGDKTDEFKEIKDFETLKRSLVGLCVTFGIDDDPDIDNGALLLFRVDSHFKKAYVEQQRQLEFHIMGEKKVVVGSMREMEEKEEPSHSPLNQRIRYLEKTTWLEEFLDYNDMDTGRKMSEAVYGERFDSLLKSWFEFVQIADSKECIIKLEFRLNRLKDQFEERKVFHQEVFFEFLRAYMKLLVLKARDNILKIYDGLNFFRSVERTICLRKQEIHLASKEELADSVMKTLCTKQGSSSQKSLSKLDREEGEGSLEDSGLAGGKGEKFSVEVVRSSQENKIMFCEDKIDIYSSDNQLILYDIVLKDFEDVAGNMLRVGAHLIDMNREKRSKKGNFSPTLDDIDREYLLVKLLEHEAKYQFAKAKYVNYLLEILRNTFTVKHSMGLMRYVQETIAKRPQFSLFDQSLKMSYIEETKHYEQLGALAFSIISYQKSHENSFGEFQEQVFSNEEAQDLNSLHKEIFKPPVYSLSARGENSGTGGGVVPPADEQADSILAWDQANVKVVEKEFEVLKPYESLTKIFLVLCEVEKAADAAVKNLDLRNNELGEVFRIRKMIVEEASETWEQIKHSLTFVSSVKDYEVLHCDVLLDIPNSSYSLLKAQGGSVLNLNEASQTPSAAMSRKGSIDTGENKGQRQGSMTTLNRNSNNAAAVAKKNEFISEEKYFQNFIEFIKLKETLLVSLLSSGYQAKIYLYQTQVFEQEDMYRDIAEKSGDFQKHFLNLLLNLENLQFCFNLKDLGDCKLIVLDHNKLEDLWTISEYLLLSELLLQNALYLNNYYMLDVMKHVEKDGSKFFKALGTSHSQKLFFNIVDKKNEWFLQAKINPALFTGKIVKSEKQQQAASEWSKGKIESVQEVIKYLRRYIYHDALRIQTIEVSRLLRRLVQKLGATTGNIFVPTDLYVEAPTKGAYDVSEIFEETGEELTEIKLRSRYSRMFEEYLDNTGKWRDPFVIPSAQDIIHMQLEPNRQKTMLNVGGGDAAGGAGQKKGKGYVSFAQKISQAWEEEMNVKKLRRKKSRENPEDTQRPQQLAFIKDCGIMQILEWNHYLLQILSYEVLPGIIQANSFDAMLLHEGGPKEREAYKRNELRLDQNLSTSVIWLKKFKEQITQVLRGLRPGETKDVAKELLIQTLKSKYKMTLLACVQCAQEARKHQDVQALKTLRRFMIETTFNSLEYVYNYNEKLCFHEYFQSLQVRKDPFMREVSFQDSEALKLLDFVFMEPTLAEKSKSAGFSQFIQSYSRKQEGLLADLFLLNREFKANISAKITEMTLLLDKAMLDTDLRLNENPIQYLREVNRTLKSNLKMFLVQEALVCWKTRSRPFTSIPVQAITDMEKNIHYHYTQAFRKHMEGRKVTTTREFKKEENEKREEEDITRFQADSDRIKVLRNVLTVELEKVLLKEGTSLYMKNVKSMSIPRLDTLKDFLSENEKDKVLKGMDHHRFLPFFYGFASKILNKSLFIDAQNLGECIVIPLSSFEHQLHELNKSVLEYYEEVEYEVQRKYNGKISVLKSQLEDMTQGFEQMKHRLSLASKDQERAIEARLAEEGTKVVFQVDMLKKRVNYILEEQEFLLKEVREKIRQEFRDKLLEDEIAMKRLKKRFYEYKEGMAFDLGRFIETEKNQTMKAIVEKKSQIFLTTQPEMMYRTTYEGGGGGSQQEDLFEYRREPEDGKLVAKLYDLLKKTRVLYQFREIVTKEKCQREINEFKKKLLGNQTLMHKLNDLQNSEANLKEGLTEARKELAIMEKRNKVLRKTLQKDSHDKIRLFRETTGIKQDCSEVQMKYEDALKRKAIFISIDEPVAGNVQQTKFFLKSHIDTIAGSKSPMSMVDSSETLEHSNKGGHRVQKSALSSDILKSMLERKQITSENPSPSRITRPMTSTSKITPKSPSNSMMGFNFGEKNKERVGSAVSKGRSFREAKSPTEVKTVGLKVNKRKKSSGEDKAFLVKKFVQKDTGS